MIFGYFGFCSRGVPKGAGTAMRMLQQLLHNLPESNFMVQTLSTLHALPVLMSGQVALTLERNACFRPRKGNENRLQIDAFEGPYGGSLFGRFWSDFSLFFF